MSGKLGRMGAAARRFMGVLRNVGFAAVAAGTALVAATKKVAQWGAAVYDAHTQTGISIERMQAFSYVSEQFGGSTDTVAKALRGMSTFMRMADSETSEQAETLQKLNLEYEELMGLQPDELFLRVTDALEQNTEGMERMTSASILFGGRYAQQVLGMMEQSEGTIRDSVDGFEQLGLTVGTDTVTKLKRFDDAMTTLGYMLKEMLAEGFEPLLPTIKDLLRSLIEMAADVMPALVPGLEAVVNLLDLFAVALDAAMPLIKGTAELAGWLGEQIGIVAEVLGGFPELQREAVDGFKDLTDSMKDAVESGVLPVDQAASQLRGHIDLLSDTFGVHSAAVRQARDAYREFLAQLAILQQDIGEVQRNLEASVIAGTTDIDIAQARYEQVLRENADAIEGGREALNVLHEEQQKIADDVQYYMNYVSGGGIGGEDELAAAQAALDAINEQIGEAEESQRGYNETLSQGTRQLAQYASNLRDEYAQGMISASEAAEMLRTQITEYNRYAQGDYGTHQIQNADLAVTQFIGSLEGATSASEDLDSATSGAAGSFAALEDREKKLLEGYESELAPKLLQNIADRAENEREYFEMVSEQHATYMQQVEERWEAEGERVRLLSEAASQYFEVLGFESAKAMERAYSEMSESSIEKMIEVAETQREIYEELTEIAARYWRVLGYESQKAMVDAMEEMSDEGIDALRENGEEMYDQWREQALAVRDTMVSIVDALEAQWVQWMQTGKFSWSDLINHMEMEIIKLVATAAFKTLMQLVFGGGGVGGAVMGLFGLHAGGNPVGQAGGIPGAHGGLSLPDVGPYGDRHLVAMERGEVAVSAAANKAIQQGTHPTAGSSAGGDVHIHSHSVFSTLSEVELARLRHMNSKHNLGGVS